MLGRLFLLFTITTLVEMALLIQLAQLMGLLSTLALVVVTGIIGAALAQREGARAWLAIQEQLAAGKMPTDGLLDGLAVLIAGAFLLTPGVLTDVLGFALLIPAARAPLKAWITARLKKRVENAVKGGRVHVVGAGPTGAPFGNPGEPTSAPFGASPFGQGPAASPFGAPFERPRAHAPAARGGGEIIEGEVAEAEGVYHDGDVIDVRAK